MMRAAFPISIVLGLLCGCSRSKDEKIAPPNPPVTKVDPATAGILTGSVRFSGAKPARKTIAMDGECARLHARGRVPDESIVVSGNGMLANVFIYVRGGLEGKRFEVPEAPVTIDQKGCWFHPRTVGIQAGQALNVTNSDPVTHNIHPMGELNREWNHSQAPGDGPLSRRFIRPEVMIKVKCNIHSWMQAYVGVVEHPYFAVTGKAGAFEISNVPPGDYRLAAWHETLGLAEQRVTVPRSGKANVAFIF